MNVFTVNGTLLLIPGNTVLQIRDFQLVSQ